ncbi:TetR/AcrR family transcriptional regulator [Mycobacterium sp. pW049]|uniref:TetR/AcrR family transcriptional regulator n=1 Tax=[Mycobacterium] bulgaricum TaxID=3238985 RepID=UPI00351AC9D6
MEVALPTRSLRKREAILSAGQYLFLAHGYKGTSVDQIAAAAAVSKQTVYKHFGDKRELLSAIVSEVVDEAVKPFVEHVAALAETTTLEQDLIALATTYLRSVLSESVVQLRRLVIAEAAAVPDLAALYYDHAPAETLRVLDETFGRLADRGLLAADDPRTAAEHFAFLVVGKSIDKALFFGGPETLSDLDVDAHARSGVRVFLAAYGPR